MDPVILIGILTIVLVAAGMVAALVVGNSSARKERALSIIKGQYAEGGDGGDRAPRNEQDKRRAEIAKKLKEQDNVGDKGDKTKFSRTALLEQAGLRITPAHYWILSCVSSLLLLLIAKLMGMSPVVMAAFFIIGLLGLPRFVLRRLIKRRQKKFLTEFADALEAMARLLKAGMPVSEAVAMAGREFEGPVGDEMSQMYEAQKVGISLPEAALAAARRMPLTEMQMLATGLAIQAQTGASLSEVLNNLAKVIRARYRLRRKVQALSSEAKSSAMIISALPLLVGGGLALINPNYMDPLFTSTAGKTLIAGSAVWMSLGIFVMKIMINFRI
jgi:tight adherence protein B